MSDIDVSVCIPYAEDYPHIYFTLNQLATVLVASKLTHEFIIVSNNFTDKFARCPACNHKFKIPKVENAHEMLKRLIVAPDFGSYHNAKLLVNDIPGNGPAANMAAAQARGKYLCFTDSHVVVHPNIFTECIKVMDEHADAGMVHAPITWTGIPYDKDFNFIPGKRCYQYRYREWDTKKHPGEWYLEQHFHGTYNHHLVSPNPYPIAGCGHGFFMVRHDTWKKTGGYHPAQMGYGGREPFVTFKMWLFGYRNFTVPTTNHIHFNGPRHYYWCMDWWYENCMQQAYSIGGDKWLDKIYTKFKANPKVRPEVITKLRNAAKAKSEEQRKFVVANQKCEFDELFKKWDDTGVFY